MPCLGPPWTHVLLVWASRTLGTSPLHTAEQVALGVGGSTDAICREAPRAAVGLLVWPVHHSMSLKAVSEALPGYIASLLEEGKR